MYSRKVSISGLNLEKVATEKTTLPGFLDGLGQLLVLLHTDPYGEKRQPGQRTTPQQVFYPETADHLLPQRPELYLP